MIRKPFHWLALGVLSLASASPGVAAGLPGVTEPAGIRTFLKPSVFARLSDDREVLVHAELADLEAPGGTKQYSFYGAMTVRAGLARARRILLDYPLYAKVIPYIDKVEFEPKRNELLLQGGIWKFQLRSRVRFEEKGERWLKYTLIAGHFTGLSGDLILEPLTPDKTLIYFAGGLKGTDWPPKLVIERGAEIVFGFTGRRMRNYIETENQRCAQSSSTRNSTQGASDGDQIPQPRSGSRPDRGGPSR